MTLPVNIYSVEAALINDNYNSSFYFIPGKTYRLRVINMAGFATFYFDIDGHNMDIIEVDGVIIFRCNGSVICEY